MQIHELTEANLMQKLKQGVQAVAQSPALSPQAYAKTQQQKYAQQASQAAEKLRAQGYKPSAPAVSATAGTQEVIAAVGGGTTSKYFKTGNTWTNELGEPVTNPKSIEYLESILADQVKTTAPTAGTQSGGAIMTSVDVDQAIRQLGLTQQQLKAFQSQAQQNPGFVRAFLKRLGLIQ